MQVKAMTNSNMTDNTAVIAKNNKGNFLTGAALVAVVGLATATWWLADKLETVEARLAQTPPVVVIDFVSLVDSYGNPTAEELDKRMIETRDAVAALRDAGYLVLDAANVVAAPEDLFITETSLGGN